METTKRLDLELPKQDFRYSIFFQFQGLRNLSTFFDFSNYSRIGVFTDERVAGFWLQELLFNIPKKVETCVLPSGESNKNLITVESCWSWLLENNFDRKSLLIALGGGVIGDITGFVASTYMRGIDFVQIPTTIIAQADSSIGGKTGVDFQGRKNYIGSFWNPKMVLIDVNLLTTLPSREKNQGLAEIIKHSLIGDLELFNFFLENKRPAQDFSLHTLEQLLFTSCQIKKRIVERDPYESKGLRKLLNFGHTFGHAVESVSWDLGVNLLHGEAVAIGIVAESFLSYRLGWLTQKDLDDILSVIMSVGLPHNLDCFRNKIQTVDLARKLEVYLLGDKKNFDGQIKWTLLKNIGQAVIDATIDNFKVTEVLEFFQF